MARAILTEQLRREEDQEGKPKGWRDAPKSERKEAIALALAAARVLLSIEPSEGMIAFGVEHDRTRDVWSAMQAQARKELLGE